LKNQVAHDQAEHDNLESNEDRAAVLLSDDHVMVASSD
jgi:hypothetical protein